MSTRLDRAVRKEVAAIDARRAAGMVDGKHYSAHTPAVKAALRAGDVDEAAGLLLRLVAAVEREAKQLTAGAGTPPWFHEQLANIYRKRGMHREAGLLMQRYAVLATESEVGSALARSNLLGAAASPPERAGTRRSRSHAAEALGRWLGRLFRGLNR